MDYAIRSASLLHRLSLPSVPLSQADAADFAAVRGLPAL